MLSGSFNLNLGKYSIPLLYWQVLAIVFLIFLLILSLAQFRRHTVDWSLRGAIFGVFFGFLLALLLEGFLIISGRTVITEILGWKNAPKPLTHAIEAGRLKLVKVLGITDQVPSSYANSTPTASDAVEVLQSLNPGDIQKVKSLICQP